MLAAFLKLFDLMRERRVTASKQRTQFLEDLLSFCSDSEAAIAQFYLAREGDADGPRSDATMKEFIGMQRLDGVAQRLQIQVRNAFPETKIPEMFFELIRRLSLSKQSLIIAETAYIRSGFLADQEWVQFQVRRTVSAVAHASGVDLKDSALPFLVGFHTTSEIPADNSDETAQPPSGKIAYEHSVKLAKAKLEAAGGKWDEAWFNDNTEEALDKIGSGGTPEDSIPEGWRNILPKKSKYKFSTETVTSLPIGEQYFAFEYSPQGHAPPLNLKNGKACASISFNCRMVMLDKVFMAEVYPLNILQPAFLAEARVVLETYSLAELSRGRTQATEEIVKRLSPVFWEQGFKLESVSIGAVDKLS